MLELKERNTNLFLNIVFIRNITNNFYHDFLLHQHYEKKNIPKINLYVLQNNNENLEHGMQF